MNAFIRCYTCSTEKQINSREEAAQFIRAHDHYRNDNRRSGIIGRRVNDGLQSEYPPPASAGRSFLLIGRRRGDKWWQ